MRFHSIPLIVLLSVISRSNPARLHFEADLTTMLRAKFPCQAKEIARR